MPVRFVAVVLLCAAATPAAAETDVSAEAPATPAPGDWTVTIGGGALVTPSYPGASSSRWMPLPFIDLRYRNLLFASPIAGVGVNLVFTRRLQIGVAALPDFGRSASASDRLRGWGDVGLGANVRLFGSYLLGPVAVIADARRQLGAGNGTLISAGLTRNLPIARHLIVVPAASLTWADARYSRAYFGIDADQSATALAQGFALPAHAARAGLRDAAVSLFAIVPLDDRWSLQSLVRAEVLLGDAAASPLTERRVQPTFGGFVACRL